MRIIVSAFPPFHLRHHCHMSVHAFAWMSLLLSVLALSDAVHHGSQQFSCTMLTTKWLCKLPNQAALTFQWACR